MRAEVGTDSSAEASAAPAEESTARFVAAVRPLVDAIGGELLAVESAAADDVVLHWEGRQAAAVRLPHLAESLDRILDELERRHGLPLAQLDRRTKQSVVHSLEARGVFEVRHGVERVAQALGVSRFTVYNYINSREEQRARREPG